MAELSGSLAPLQHANFRWYWIALTVNLAGTTMSAVALAFAVLDISDSPNALGLVLAAGTTPIVVFLLFGGVIADRWPLTAVLRIGMVVLAASQGAVAALVITGTAEIWMLVVLSAINGTAMALVLPAMQSITPRLVTRDLLQRAIALQSFSRGGAPGHRPDHQRFARGGRGRRVGARLRRGDVVRGRDHPGASPAPTSGTTRGGEHDGRRAPRRMGLRAPDHVAVGGRRRVHLPQRHLRRGLAQPSGRPGPTRRSARKGGGSSFSAESVGLIVAAVVLLHRPLQRPLFTGMVWTATLAVPLVVLGVYPHVWLMLVVTFVAGIGFDVFGMGWNLAMQEHVPPEMLSRAYSYDALGSYLAIPLGQVAFGPLGVAFGYRDVLVVSAVAYVVICLLVLSSRSVRDLRRVPVEVTVS